jgi:hypothetical protein
MLMQFGLVKQRVKAAPEPVGKFGWSVPVLEPRFPWLLYAGDTLFVPGISISVDGQALTNGSAFFDDILTKGGGRFNQFNSRIFFSLPAGVAVDAISRVSITRPIALHWWWQVLAGLLFLHAALSCFGRQLKLAWKSYESYCACLKTYCCVPFLLIVLLAMIWNLQLMFPPQALFFSPDSEGYLFPENAESMHRTFGFVLVGKLVRAVCAGELWPLGILQWLLYAASVISLSAWFEKRFNNVLAASFLGVLLLVKISAMQWAFYAGPDTLFGVCMIYLAISSMELILANQNRFNHFAMLANFYFSIALRPIGICLGLLPFASICASWRQSRKRFFACLLALLAVPVAVSASDTFLTGLWKGKPDDKKLVGVCLLGSYAWFMDRDMPTSYPLLRTMIVDAVAPLQKEFSIADFQKRLLLDLSKFNVMAWEIFPVVFDRWKHTPEAKALSIDPDERLGSIYTSLALDIVRSRPTDVLSLYKVRFGDLLLFKAMGEWHVDLHFNLSANNSYVKHTEKTYQQFIQRYSQATFKTRDPGHINLFMSRNLLYINCASLLVCAATFFTSIFQFARRKFSQQLVIIDLLLLQIVAYWFCVGLMQPVLFRYTEPAAPLFLMVTIASLMYWAMLLIESLKGISNRNNPN